MFYTSAKKWFHHYISMLVCLCLLSTLGAQSNDPGIKRRKLMTSDYKGIPDESSGFLARTHVLLSYDYYSPVNCAEKNKIRFQFETKASVSDKSWMKLNRIKSQELLNELLSHEQGHYDINEAFASDLKNKLSNICFDKYRYKVQIDSTFRIMNRYYDSLQLTYDSQTENMRNRDMQVKWKQKIEALIKKTR
jgi:hypothetical protein